VTEKDPGTQGKKLSKSDSEVQHDARNKSYNKVLDTQAAYIWAAQSKADNVEDFLRSWKKKSEWHEKEFGW